MDSTRKIIVDLLSLTLKGKFVEDSLSSDERIAGLEPRDKNFVRASLLTTLRHLGEIDHFLHRFTQDKENILRVGVAQLKFMDMPAHAVINELVKIAETDRHKSFINAVLRKADERELERNSKLNIPKWMTGAWRKAYGEEKQKQIIEILLTEPNYVDLSFKRDATPPLTPPSGGRISTQTPLPEGATQQTPLPEGATQQTPLPEGGVGGGFYFRVYNPPPIIQIEGFEEGNWWVQDKSQTYAAEMMGDIKGKKVLDMCAAPGGKTAQLIDGGAIVTALDSSEKRLERLQENLQRLGMECEIICEDAREFGHAEYDFILLDAPCTATGTIRRHPEILHSCELDDLYEMVIKQNKLISNAYNLLKEGGVLVYSTCSLQYEECEGLVKKLEGWELLEEKRILPCDHEGGIGGAYVAKLRKL